MSQEKKFFIPQRTSRNHVELHEVNKELYEEITRDINRTRKQMQRSGECSCTKDKFWQCDGVCQDCPFYHQRTLSIDEVVYENTSDGSSITLADTIADPNSTNLEEKLLLKFAFEQLCEYLDTLDPAYRKIFDCIKMKSDLNEDVILRKVADEMNMPWSTFKSRLSIIREAFKKYSK